MKTGLRQDELRRRLGQDVVAIHLLGWRRLCWRHAHCIQEDWGGFLVLNPDWCRVVDVLVAGRKLSKEERERNEYNTLYHVSVMSTDLQEESPLPPKLWGEMTSGN